MKIPNNLINSAALALALVAGFPLHADVVSWNKDVFGTIPESGTDTAGVVNAAWWNNSWPDADQDTVNLQDSNNNPTTIDLTLTQPATYRIQGSGPALDADGTHNKRLLNGYMNAGTGQGGGVTSIAISQIPYTSYSIYVYFSSDVAGRIGTVTDGTTTYEFSTVGPPSISGTNAVFTQATTPAGTGTNPAANYAVFSGLTSASQTVTVNIPTFGGIAGIQIEGVLPAGIEFVEQPSNQSVAVDSTATFPAAAAGNPAPEYQWEYSADGNSDWTELIDETNATLEIPFVQFSDVGYYRVIATNTNGSVTSDVASLDVFYDVPEFFEQPANAYAEEGSTVELTADAFTYGDPSYQWYKDGDPLPGETDFELVRTNVDSSDAGEYFLRVFDDIEPGLFADSDVATVNVFPAWDGLVSHDPFDTASGYTLGELPLQNPAITGFDGPWIDIDFGNAEPEVQSGSLSYADPLYIGSSGARVAKAADAAGVTAANSGRTYRELAPALVVANTTTGVRYLSFLYQNGNENAAAGPTVYSALALYNAGTADANRNFEAGVANDALGANLFYRVNNVEVGDLGTPLDSDVHLFVVKFDLSDQSASDVITVWIDPQLGSGEPAGGVSVSNHDVVFDRLAFSDYASNSMAWDEIRWGSNFDGVTLNPNPSNDFASWVSSYSGVGTMTGFTEDADGDGIPNGVENFFGTDPSASNPGITQVAKSGNTVTFQHPQNATPASDVSASYNWSTDLSAWNADGATSGGTTVTFAASPNTPTAGITSVIATITGTVPEKLFVTVEATLSTP